jgi:hypothetical protein
MTGLLSLSSYFLLVGGPWSALYELGLRADLPFPLSRLVVASFLGRSGGALMVSLLNGITLL